MTLLTGKATAGACAAMVAVGGLLAIYGSAVVDFKGRFDLDDATAGSALAIQSVGAVIGVLAAQPLLRWQGNRFTMTSALLLIAAGCALVAGSPAWPVTLAGAAVAGLGLGGCDALTTQLFVFGQGRRGPVLVNIAHGCFGLGTVAAPLVIAFAGAGTSPLVFGGIAVVAVAAAATMTGVTPRPTPADIPVDGHRTGGAPVVAAFLVLYILHFGVQSGVGIWGPTRLLELGYSTATASLVIAGYWLAMVIGRFAVAPMTARVSPPVLVTVSCAGMLVATAVSSHGQATAWAYVIAGLFVGPIFPNGLTWLARTGHAHGPAFAYVIAAAMAGAAVFPPLLGTVIGAHGPQALAVVLSVMSAGAVVACAVVVRYESRGRNRGEEPPTIISRMHTEADHALR